MSAGAPASRRLARVLLAHAAAVLPPGRAGWAQAMCHEGEQIESGPEALRWAAGCVLASYVERTRLAELLHSGPARALLLVVIAWQTVSMLFATLLTLAVRTGSLRVAAFLGGFTPGDDYRRFLPLIEAAPLWMHALWVTASLLFAISGLELMRDRARAFPLFATAWVLGTAGHLGELALPAYRAVFSFPEPQLTRDVLLPVATALLPVLVGLALWAHARFTPRFEAPPSGDSR